MARLAGPGSETVTNELRAVLFANPRSGRSSRWLREVAQQSEKHGIRLISTHFDLGGSAIRDALESARGRGVDAVLACGGDGTMGAVSSVLCGEDLPMGVLPAGTANDFARSLHIPCNAAGALSVIAARHATRIDLGQVNDRIFCHAVTVGINSQFAETAQSLRRSIGRLSYPVASVWVYVRRRQIPMTISVDGCPEAKRAYAVAFVNAPVYGGPLELRVDVVNMKDRKLGLVVVEDMGVRTALLGALSLLRKHRLRVPGVESLPCSEGRIETAMELPVTVDGEICIRTPIDVHILPSALAVFVPAQRDVPTESISQAQSDRRPGTESRRAAG